jgi:hypothetical protein
VCTAEQKEKIKKLALAGNKPQAIKKKMPGLDWTNKQIGTYISRCGLAEKIEKIEEKAENKLIERISDKKADFKEDIAELINISLPELTRIIKESESESNRINAIKVVMDISGLKKENLDVKNIDTTPFVIQIVE